MTSQNMTTFAATVDIRYLELSGDRQKSSR